MLSSDLLKEGFTELENFHLPTFGFGNPDHKLSLSKTGLYVFALDKKFVRLKGETDLIYIGQSGGRKGGKGRGISSRINDYRVGSEKAPHDKKIHDSLERIYVMTGAQIRLLYKFAAKEFCREEEKKLILRFYEEHLEIPSLNGQF